MEEKEYITTSDGKVSVRRSEFLGHSISEGGFGLSHIVIRTNSQPNGYCVNYESQVLMNIAAKEITAQLYPHHVKRTPREEMLQSV